MRRHCTNVWSFAGKREDFKSTFEQKKNGAYLNKSKKLVIKLNKGKELISKLNKEEVLISKLNKVEKLSQG